MIDAAELNRKLNERAEEICALLLPAGKKRGNTWLVGDITGAPGESLHITISGGSAGRFVDFSNKDNKGGTMLWLWSKVKNIPYVKAIEEACDFLGVKSDEYGVKRHKPKTYNKPPAVVYKQAEPMTAAQQYLVEQRKIDPLVVANAKIGQSDDGSEIVFSFADFDKEKNMWMVAHRKFLKIERPNGKKVISSTKGTKRCLFGKNMVSDDVNEIVICEGEIDALTWHSYGIPAVSVPNGVSDSEWIDVDWDWLARFEKIYLSMDSDEPGQVAAQEFVKRLGLHRSYIVTLPQKDANECLVGGVKREDMLKCIAEAKPIELDEIKRASDFRREINEHFQTDPSQQGWSTPWDSFMPWRVRPGELTVFSGFSGSGKTQGLNHLCVHLIMQGVKVMDASLEIRSSKTLYHMVRCALGKKAAEQDEIDGCIDWLSESLYVLDCIGTVNIDRIMSAMEYSRKRHGTDVFIIDSLFKCGIDPDNFGDQRAFMDRLTTFCNNTGAHVILVAHSRKTQNGNEMAVPSKSDISGSSDIQNAAFNILIFWRNKMKKRKLDEATQAQNDEEVLFWQNQPDGKILLDKQRFGEGEECELLTYFSRDSCQFHPNSVKSLPYFQK